MENFQLPPEIVTAVFTAIATWMIAAANTARTSSAERAFILRTLEAQTKRVTSLESQLVEMQGKYEQEVERGNRLEDELRQVRLELDEVKTQRDSLERRVADGEARNTATMEVKIVKE